MDRIDIDNLICKHTYHVGELKQVIIDVLNGTGAAAQAYGRDVYTYFMRFAAKNPKWY